MINNQLRIGALISGTGTNLQAVFDACQNKKIHGRMVFVGADRPDAAGLEKAAQHNIPTFVVDYGAIISAHQKEAHKIPHPADGELNRILKKQTLFGAHTDPERQKRFFSTRILAEAQLLEKMRPFRFDLLVLAGFMRNLTPYFIDKVNTVSDRPRIMNIHPALLPAFAGTDGYGDTFRYGCKVGGCTVHFVDYGEDSGPIIGQKAFAVQPGDTLEDIRKKGLLLEWQLYPECIQLFAQNRLRIQQKTHTTSTANRITRRLVTILPAPDTSR